MSSLHVNQGKAHDHQLGVPGQEPQEVHVDQTLDNDGQYREEHSWPTIRRYALGQIGPGDKAIKAVCPVCKSQISVAGLPRPDGEGKEGLVTPCGHIICSDCWPEKNSRALPENEVSFQRPNCPLCNQSLDCVGCGRSCTKQEVPEYSLCIEYIEAVPPTYPETELTYMPFCIGRCGAVPGSFGRWFPLHGQE